MKHQTFAVVTCLSPYVCVHVSVREETKGSDWAARVTLYEGTQRQKKPEGIMRQWMGLPKAQATFRP